MRGQLETIEYPCSCSGLFGSPIPIKVVMADQSASVFGSGCYRTGFAKITMGTGSFLDVVTSTPHASLNGLIPLVAWKIREETVFLAEGSVHDTGVVVEWARSVALFEELSSTSQVTLYCTVLYCTVLYC